MSDSVLGFSLCLHSSLFTMSWQVPLPSFYVLQKMSPNSAARQLTYSFLSDLCPLHLHFIGSFAPSQFPSLDFPPRVGYFWFKHIFCQACRAISQLLPSFQLPDTADIQSPLSPHVSKISKKILNNVPREFGESISQVNNPWKGDYESLLCFAVVPNAPLAEFHIVICVRNPGIVSVLRHVHYHTFPSSHGLQVNINYP